jgi:hypothetical protein
MASTIRRTAVFVDWNPVDAIDMPAMTEAKEPKLLRLTGDQAAAIRF